MHQNLASFFRNRFINPIINFLHDSRAIGITLLACTFVSLLLANLSFGQSYADFWMKEVHIPGPFHLPHSILHWINDGLMALFFFLAGMEIKSELVSGELSTPRKSILPLLAAVGGMIAPAIIFILFNKGTDYNPGWAIPTATDIAFSLGIASLLGKRIPVALIIFLTALAIIDDLGAIIVIALFYGEPVKFIWLFLSLVVAILTLRLFKIKSTPGYVHIIAGIVLWYCMFNSGIHATVAGVVFAFLIPAKKLHSLVMKLHKPVYFLIMPLFALANTAIIFPDNISHSLNSTLSWGIMAGLFIGKPAGICLVCYYLVKRKLAVLPRNTNWKQMIGIGMLAGIGFTMSIFIATLAFKDKQTQDIAKISVLIVSFVSMIAGYTWLRITSRQKDEIAESSK